MRPDGTLDLVDDWRTHRPRVKIAGADEGVYL
jgi:hypothetical protein